MEFHAGDTVMHRTFGLGTVIGRQKRDLLGHETTFYAVRIGAMTIWVPADDELKHRLRAPVSGPRLKRLVRELATPGDQLPLDRHDRKLMLAEFLKDGSAASLVRVIRALMTYQRVHPLNENDQSQLRRVQSALVAEWAYALSMTEEQAGLQMRLLLSSVTV